MEVEVSTAQRLHNDCTLWELLCRRSASNPDDLLFVEGDNEQLSVTVNQAHQLAEGLAANLYARGVRAGETVVWQMPTRLNTVLLSLALSRLGVVQNPIIPFYRERELAHMLDQNKASWIVVPEADADCDYPSLAASVASSRMIEVVVLGDEWELGDVAKLPPAPQDPHAISWIYCTSGTTSAPKGALHTDATIMTAANNFSHALMYTKNDVCSFASPYTHVGGTQNLMMALLVGMPVVLIEKSNPQTLPAIFQKYGVTTVGGSTVHYQFWLGLQREASKNHVLPTLRLMAGGGAGKPPQLFHEVKEEMGVPIIHAYGLTECPVVASNYVDSPEVNLLYTDGKVTEGNEVKIRRSNGDTAAIGEEGEILVRGVSLCKGYLDVEQTRKAFDNDGFFCTGDLGVLGEDNYLTVTGRIKDIIIRKGENISAKEVEDLLIQYPNVKGVAVIGLPDRERGERLCAVIELAEQKTVTLRDVNDFLIGKGLIKRKCPEQLEIIDALPRNQALGKVVKEELKKRYKSLG